MCLFVYLPFCEFGGINIVYFDFIVQKVRVNITLEWNVIFF
jgi:hypothetical protein